MAEAAPTQQTADQWPVLPSQTDIVVKCAPLDKPAKQAEELALKLLPMPADPKAPAALEARTIDGVEYTVEEMAAKAADYLTYCTKTINLIDTKRKAYTERARTFTTDMNAEVALYVGRITKSKARVEAALLAYQLRLREEQQRKQKEEREKREREALEAAEKLQKEGASDAANRVLEVAASAPRRAAVKPLETRGEATGRKVGVRETWQGSVENLNAVLQAVIDGKLSPDGITVGQAWLNRIATAHGKQETFLGVKCEMKSSLA